MISILWKKFRICPQKSLKFLMKQLGSVCVYDKQGQVISVSRNFLRLTQTKATQVDFLNGFLSEVIGLPHLRSYWERALQGESVSFLSKSKTSDDHIEYLLEFNSETELLFLTAKKASQYTYVCQLIEQYERSILTLFNHPNLATALVGVDGTLIKGNQRLYDLLGTQASELQSIEAFIHPEDRQVDADLRQKLLDGEMESYTLEKRLLNKNNDTLWVNMSVSLVEIPLCINGHKQYFAVLLEDITENKKMYSALIRTEEKWKTLVLNNLHLFIQTSSAGQIIYASPAVEQILGYKEEELLDSYISDLIYPDDLNEFELALQLWSNGIQYGEAGIEFRWRTRSGQWVYLCIQGQRFPLALEIDGLVISGYDVTDRKFLEAKLKASEEKFRSLVLNIPGAVFRCTPSYTIKFISDEIYQISGYSASELTGNQVCSYLSIIHPEDMELIRASVQQLNLSRRPHSIEYRIIHADGTVRWVSEYRQGMFDRTGRLSWFDGVLFNISDRKQAEENLRRSEAVNRAMVRVLPTLMK